MKRRSAMWVTAVFLLGAAGAAGAQEPAQEAPQEDPMAPYVAAATPGAEHEWLASMTGKYEATVKMWMDPAGEPSVSTSSAVSEMILGGRYLADHYQGSFLGTEFEGIGLTAYDNTIEKFVSTWVDNMGTGVLVSTGERDDEGRLVMVSEFEDPASGMMMKLKSVTWTTDDGYRTDMYNILPDGTSYKSMELTAKKVE